MCAAMVLIAGAAWFCDLKKPKGCQFSDGGGNRLAVDAPLDKLVIRNNEFAVLSAAVGHMLDLNAVHDAHRRVAQHSESGALQH